MQICLLCFHLSEQHRQYFHQVTSHVFGLRVLSCPELSCQGLRARCTIWQRLQLQPCEAFQLKQLPDNSHSRLNHIHRGSLPQLRVQGPGSRLPLLDRLGPLHKPSSMAYLRPVKALRNTAAAAVYQHSLL